jgi:hypothetical protein
MGLNWRALTAVVCGSRFPASIAQPECRGRNRWSNGRGFAAPRSRQLFLRSHDFERSAPPFAPPESSGDRVCWSLLPYPIIVYFAWPSSQSGGAARNRRPIVPRCASIICLQAGRIGRAKNKMPVSTRRKILTGRLTVSPKVAAHRTFGWVRRNKRQSRPRERDAVGHRNALQLDTLILPLEISVVHRR